MTNICITTFIIHMGNMMIINFNKRPIGLIAPPFKINFLATEIDQKLN